MSVLIQTRETILMVWPYLEVAKLGKLLSAVIKLANKWFDLLMNNLVRTNIATLCKGFPTDVAQIWSLACVPSLMGLAHGSEEAIIHDYFNIPSGFRAVRIAAHMMVLCIQMV
jgi:hypothetical protein